MSKAAHQPSTTAPEANSTPLKPQDKAPTGNSQEKPSSTPDSKTASEFGSSDETLRPPEEIQKEGNSIDDYVKTGTLPVPDCSPPTPKLGKRKRPREDISIEHQLDASPTDYNEPLAIGDSELGAHRLTDDIPKTGIAGIAEDLFPKRCSSTFISPPFQQTVEDGMRTPPCHPVTEEPPSPSLSYCREKYYKRLQRLFDAGKTGLFYTLTRRNDETHPKTAVLNLVALQRIQIHLIQDALADYAAGGFRDGRFDIGFPGTQQWLNEYCNAVRNLDFMTEKAKLGYDKDPFLIKSSRALERDILERSGLIPEHLLPKGELPLPYDHDHPLLFNESGGRHHANEQTMKKQRLERFAMASFGGLLIIIPMLIMANIPGKTASLVTSCVAIAIFAALVTLGTKLGPHEVLASVAAYAAVLVVFVGLSLEKR